MQFKSITAIIVLSLVVASLLVAGCAVSTTNNKTSVEIPSVTSDKSSGITSKFSDAGYAIVTPFSKSTNNYGNVVYTGVVKDTPEKKLDPYSHKITIELTKNNNTTKARYEQYKTQLLSSGLIKAYDYGDYIYFSDTGHYDGSTRLAWLNMNEPSSSSNVYNTHVYVNLGDSFSVTLDDATKL